MPELPELHHSSHIKSESRARPDSWRVFNANIKHRWALPFLCIEWLSQWTAWMLSKTSLFELLEYCGSFSILIAVIFYFIQAPERTKLKHYQAWQVINSAQGRGGSGGRIDALEDLNGDGVSLLGVDVSDSYLRGVDLHDSDLSRANLAGADMRNANLSGVKLVFANVVDTNLVNANLSDVDVSHADFKDADLTNADLTGLKNWRDIDSMEQTSIGGVRNAPGGFVEWAIQQGATENEGQSTTRPASTSQP